MPVVNSGGVDIAYDVLNADGPGLPVFFIAGLNGMAASCMAQAEPFSKERPVVLHDHRGTGRSAKPLGVYSVEAMAGDVVAIMDDAGIAEAHMVGTSTGGAIIQVLCIDHAPRVRSAAICCSWPKSDHFFVREFEVRKRILSELGHEDLLRHTTSVLWDPQYFAEHYEEMLEREALALANAGPTEVDLQRIDAIIAHDQLARLGRIRTPVIVIGSTNDFVCPAYYSRQLADAIPGATLKLYDGGGHFFYLIHVEEFNDDIRRFIAANE